MKNRSATEIRMGKRYSIRRPGMTAWASTDSVVKARTLQRQADDCAGRGHEIVDNRTLEEVVTREHE